MPELPEVERVRAELHDRLVAEGVRRVADVRVARRDVVVMPGDPPGGFARRRRPGVERAETPRRLRPALLGRGEVIRGVGRHGKALGIRFDRAAVGVHLGMSGALRVLAPGERLDTLPHAGAHAHVIWSLTCGAGENAGRLVFTDPRRFGGVWGFASGEDLDAHHRATIGPDALLIQPDRFIADLRRTRRALKAALLDQRLIAGVGNIYADEALHRAGLDPHRLGVSLAPQEAERLLGAIQSILRAAIEHGGSTIRDYVGSSGMPGAAQFSHAVYGRSGEPCRTCSTELRGEVLAARATVWCPVCQQ